MKKYSDENTKTVCEGEKDRKEMMKREREKERKREMMMMNQRK